MNVRQRARRAEHADLPAPETGEPAEPLVSDEEIEEIRWAGYDAAIADAIAHRDRALEAARERLDKVIRAAHLEYGQALDAAETAYYASRRAAMNAHELARAGHPVPA